MSRPLAIASVCRELPTPSNSSAGLFILRRLAAMASRADVKVLQPVPYFPVLRPLPEWGNALAHYAGGLRIEHAPMFYLPKFFKTLDSSWLCRSLMPQLKALQANESLDVIDAHFGYPDGVACVRAGQMLGIPVFITIRGVEEDYLNNRSIARQLRQALKMADGCIAVSHSLRELAIEEGVSPDRVRVIQNAVDRRLFRPGDRTAARLAVSSVSEGDTRLVVSVGNLLSVKRHHVLIRAFADLLKVQPAARLVIIGAATHEPRYPGELKNLCEQLNVAPHVTFAGKLPPEDVAVWLQAADVFSLASRREGCCNALLEALAIGLPVVTTPVGDNKWFVREGQNGYLVPVDDHRAMAKALEVALTRSDWDRHRISSRLEVGNWDTVASKVLDFFAERADIARNAFVRNAQLT